VDKTVEPQASDWNEDLSDAPNDDPGATEAIRFAGCSVQSELIDMGAKTQ
jgi:hypothetical protein